MYLGVDIGASKTLVAMFDQAGQIQQEQKLPTTPDYKSFMNSLQLTMDQMLANGPAKSIAVAAPGLIDYQTQLVKSFGNLEWRNADIKQRLATKYQPLPVAIEHDVNVGALHEANLGSGKNYRVVLYITISTGIGTGITTEGKIDPALAKSEGGMMLFWHDGKLQCWEEFASGKAFLKRFGKLGKDVSDQSTWDQYAQDLSQGFGSLIAVIQPDVVVVGGSMGNFLDRYQPKLVELVQTTKGPTVEIPPIVMAREPDRAVLHGCYLLAKETAR